MFFEATYVPSPPLSIASIDDQDNLESLNGDDDNRENITTSGTANSTSSIIEEELDVEPTLDKPVDHVIFVIHGIGQQTEQYGHFYEHIENLQETTRQVLQAKVPDHNVRIELIPIEWHRHIHDQVDPILNKITLKSIPTIRLIENEYLADVLFYFSKDMGQKIVDNVTHLYNTSYHNFMEKHPDFDGKIIIMGYSLGGIITWDILSHQRLPQNEKEQDMYNKLDVKFGKLDFKPHYFFGLGSPISAVLTFRGQDPTLYHPDFDTIKIENIFHPFDPLGYRFEPLFNEYFTDKPAVLVERSVPIGPSFSFPSMPSFPISAGFLSFFSWKQGEKVNASDASKALFEATEDAVKAGEIEQEEDEMLLSRNQQEEAVEHNASDNDFEQQQSAGFMSSFNSLVQYFSKSKGAATPEPTITDSKNATNSSSTEMKDDNHGGTTNALRNGDIITWDPLREQTREQLLKLRDDLDRTLNMHLPEEEEQPKSRPSMRTRSNTFTNTTATTVASSASTFISFEQQKPSIAVHSPPPPSTSSSTLLSVQQPTLKKSTSTSTVGSSSFSNRKSSTKPERIALRKAMTEEPRKQRHHLVEVLNIDGVRFDRTNSMHNVRSPDTLQSDASNANSNKDEDNKESKDDESETMKQHEREQNVSIPSTNTTTHGDENKLNGHGGNNLWLDLNNELNKPGPAITSPGESRAEVAQDATVPDSNSAQSSSGATLTDAEQEKLEINKLPGQHRMDYVLQPESVMSMIANEYLIGLRAHFSYWTNKDFLWHMLRRIENLPGDEELLQERKKKNEMELAAEEKTNKKKNYRNSMFAAIKSNNSSVISISDSVMSSSSNKSKKT